MKQNKVIKDPHAKREASTYDNPIPSREYILQHLTQKDTPQLFEEIAAALHLASDDELEALRRRLIAMLRDGQLLKMRTGKYGVIDKMDLIRGTVIGHADGHGFLNPEEGGSDLFLPPKQMQAVFDGDLVVVRKLKTGYRGRVEVSVVRVLERKNQKLIGRFFKEAGMGFVIPDNRRIAQDIIIPPESEMDADIGDIVSVEIVSPPTMRNQAVGQISEILGKHMAPGLETDVAVRVHHLPYEWNHEIELETKQFPDEVSVDDLGERVDLRSIPFVTIDGEDAKDFDDAVYCEPGKKSGWTLYVAIADVSHYVKPYSALDSEAFNRGNSVYFPNRVIPMLPEKLSNGLCSLKPKVDRLVLVCQMKISAEGKVSKHEFYPAVIHSHARLTYTDVAAFLEGDKDAYQKLESVSSAVYALHLLYKKLHEHRNTMGSINFELTEPEVVFDEHKKIQSLVARERNVAHKIIEECMLAANICASSFLLKSKHTGIYRVHPDPKFEKVEDLKKYLAELGLGLGAGDNPTPKDYARVLNEIQERPDMHVIQMSLLRSLAQAFYSIENKGHFSLGFESYTHFTSPIRRYPDLLVHRAIYMILKKQKPNKELAVYVDKAAHHCSMTERRADDATRDVMSWLKCEYMLDKVGEEYSGVITSVTSFGLFVEIKGVYVEGLIHISNLDNDYYQFDPIRRRLTGQASGKVFANGDELNIRVARVDLDQRQVDFEIVTAEKKPKKRKPRK